MEAHPAIYCGHFFKIEHRRKSTGAVGPLLMVALANPTKHDNPGNGQGNMPQTVFPPDEALQTVLAGLEKLKFGDPVVCEMQSMGINSKPALVNIQPQGNGK